MSAVILRNIAIQCRNKNAAHILLAFKKFPLAPTSCPFTNSKPCLVGYQIKVSLADCYNLLNVSEDCSLEELKVIFF